jgi:hypothetical protein
MYKVSYVIVGIDHPGAIMTQSKAPKPGDKIQLQNQQFEIVEVFDIVPPRGDFHFLHATCRPANPSN